MDADIIGKACELQPRAATCAAVTPGAKAHRVPVEVEGERRRGREAADRQCDPRESTPRPGGEQGTEETVQSKRYPSQYLVTACLAIRYGTSLTTLPALAGTQTTVVRFPPSLFTSLCIQPSLL